MLGEGKEQAGRIKSSVGRKMHWMRSLVSQRLHCNSSSWLAEAPADRSLCSTDRLFGDESDLHFWTVASHYLQSFAQARQLSASAAEGQAQSEASQPSAAHNHLDICNDVLCESSYFQVSGRRRWTHPAHLFSVNSFSSQHNMRILL